jgi:hypothetical protein
MRVYAEVLQMVDVGLCSVFFGPLTQRDFGLKILTLVSQALFVCMGV